MLSNSRLQKLFFRSLELEDVDWMLNGNEVQLVLKIGRLILSTWLQRTDSQIVWFWNVYFFILIFAVLNMSVFSGVY